MKLHDPYRANLPPPSFIPPFYPPGSQLPYIPEGSSTDDDSGDGAGSTTATASDDLGPRPDWWPDDWPRLPPDHPYHVPPGYSAPHNLPPGHPGEAYPA